MAMVPRERQKIVGFKLYNTEMSFHKLIKRSEESVGKSIFLVMIPWHLKTMQIAIYINETFTGTLIIFLELKSKWKCHRLVVLWKTLVKEISTVRAGE